MVRGDELAVLTNLQDQGPVTRQGKHLSAPAIHGRNLAKTQQQAFEVIFLNHLMRLTLRLDSGQGQYDRWIA